MRVKCRDAGCKAGEAEADAAAAEKSQDAPAEAAPAQEQPQAGQQSRQRTQSGGNKANPVAKPVRKPLLSVSQILKLDALMNQVSEAYHRKRTVWCRSAPPIPEILRTSPS